MEQKPYGLIGSGSGGYEYKIHADDKSGCPFKYAKSVQEALKEFLNMEVKGCSIVIEAHLLNPLLRAFEASQITDYIVIPSMPDMRRFIYPYPQGSFSYIIVKVPNNPTWKLTEIKAEHRV